MLREGVRSDRGHPIQLLLWLTSLLLPLCTSAPLYGQEAGGSMIGIVSDPSRALVERGGEGEEDSTSMECEVRTNTDGLFVVPI